MEQSAIDKKEEKIRLQWYCILYAANVDKVVSNFLIAGSHTTNTTANVFGVWTIDFHCGRWNTNSCGTPPAENRAQLRRWAHSAYGCQCRRWENIHSCSSRTPCENSYTQARSREPERHYECARLARCSSSLLCPHWENIRFCNEQPPINVKFVH